jgi:hypothetical protein
MLYATRVRVHCAARPRAQASAARFTLTPAACSGRLPPSSCITATSVFSFTGRVHSPRPRARRSGPGSVECTVRPPATGRAAPGTGCALRLAEARLGGPCPRWHHLLEFEPGDIQATGTLQSACSTSSCSSSPRRRQSSDRAGPASCEAPRRQHRHGTPGGRFARRSKRFARHHAIAEPRPRDRTLPRAVQATAAGARYASSLPHRSRNANTLRADRMTRIAVPICLGTSPGA